MAGGGNYPIMSEGDWERAPWNQRDSIYKVCVECGGDGGIYYNEDGDMLSKVDYERLSDEDKSIWELEKCEKCDGRGEIEVEETEFELDWDDFYQ